MVDSLFSAVRENPNYDAVKALSIELLRGIALSSVLVSNPEHNQKLINQWVWGFCWKPRRLDRVARV